MPTLCTNLLSAMPDLQNPLCECVPESIVGVHHSAIFSPTCIYATPYCCKSSSVTIFLTSSLLLMDTCRYSFIFRGYLLCSVEYSCQYLEVANLASLSTSCQTTLQFLNTSCQLTFCSISASVCRVTVRLTIDLTPISLS